jgi:hypothetical protein
LCLLVVKINVHTAAVEDTTSEICTRNEVDETLWPGYDAGHFAGIGEAGLLPLRYRAFIDDMKIPCMAKVWESDVCGVVSLGGCCHGRTIGRPARSRRNRVRPFADVLSTGVSNAFASVAEEKHPILEHASKRLCKCYSTRHAGELRDSALRIFETRRRVWDLFIALRRARLAISQQYVIRRRRPGCGGAA